MPVDLEESGLDDILGLRIRRAHGAIQRHFAEHASALGLTQKQISVLWLVGDNPGLAQTDLAGALDMDRATTMALVHGLERRELLSRTPCTSDGRRIAFRLTPAGARLLKHAKTAVRQHEDWLTGRFSPEELDQLRSLLARIYR